MAEKKIRQEIKLENLEKIKNYLIKEVDENKLITLS